jgi:hypothetical protein
MKEILKQLDAHLCYMPMANFSTALFCKLLVLRLGSLEFKYAAMLHLPRCSACLENTPQKVICRLLFMNNLCS